MRAVVKKIHAVINTESNNICTQQIHWVTYQGSGIGAFAMIHCSESQAIFRKFKSNPEYIGHQFIYSTYKGSYIFRQLICQPCKVTLFKLS